MSNAVEDRFADLDYPGRRKPVNREKVVAPPEMVEWDAKPVYYKVNGEKQEFYTISHLSKALGYSQQSIRAWEASGLMPPAPFRSPRTLKPVANGRSNKGRRLWTHEAIEGIVRLAKKHKVIVPNRKGIRNPPTRSFAHDVASLFRELQEQHSDQ